MLGDVCCWLMHDGGSLCGRRHRGLIVFSRVGIVSCLPVLFILSVLVSDRLYQRCHVVLLLIVNLQLLSEECCEYSVSSGCRYGRIVGRCLGGLGADAIGDQIGGMGEYFVLTVAVRSNRNGVLALCAAVWCWDC